jgi:hypothetical protein
MIVMMVVRSMVSKRKSNKHGRQHRKDVGLQECYK